MSTQACENGTENGQNSQSATGDSDSLDYLPYTDTSNSGYKQPDSTTEGCASKNGTCLGLPPSYGGANSQSGTADQDPENAISDSNFIERNGKQIERELERGSRICFQFDAGPAMGKYLGPSMRRADAGQNLSRISWDDKTNYLVKLSPENRFGGDDSGQMKPGE